MCVRLSTSQISAIYPENHTRNPGQDKFEYTPIELNQLVNTLAICFTYIRVTFYEQVGSLSNGVSKPHVSNSIDKTALNRQTSIPINTPDIYPNIPNFIIVNSEQSTSKTLLYCSKKHSTPPCSHKGIEKHDINLDQCNSGNLLKVNDLLNLPNCTEKNITHPHIQLSTYDSAALGLQTDFQNLPNIHGSSNRSPNINQIRNRYNTVKQYAKIPISRSDTGLSGLQLPSRSASPSQFYSLYSNKSDHTLHKVTAIQTALEDNKAPTYPEARDPLRRINTPKLKLSSGPSSPILKRQPSPQSLEKLGWTILLCTWIVVIGGIGSMFGIWKSFLGYDSSAVRYSLSYEKKTGYPISEYYACLFFMTFIVSWVWCVISWMGMKFYRHTKGGITTAKSE